VSGYTCSVFRRVHEKIGVSKLTAQGKRGMTMKRITLAAIAAATVAILFAGKDDIRRFSRMRRM
jgi:hypothetical protein